jgi:hydrogenase expression/formation protein HypC
MCLAIPGKIVEIKNKTAIVQYPKERREVMLDPHLHVKKGDYVLVQMGIIMQKISKKKAFESQAAWKANT